MPVVFDHNKEGCDLTLSSRQSFCAESVVTHLANNHYIEALHELYDCIDDYGRGRDRVLSENEYTLYSCLLKIFIKKLESEEVNENT